MFNFNFTCENCRIDYPFDDGYICDICDLLICKDCKITDEEEILCLCPDCDRNCKEPKGWSNED